MSRTRRPARHRTRRTLTPVNVAVPDACCKGWFFEHTGECRTPQRSRPCSDCAAASGTEHGYDCQWWWV
jgi:hypothetical protein